MCKILIVHYSMYGHIYKMAEAVAEGVREVGGCEAIVKRVPETLTAEVLGMMGALEAQKSMAHIPIATVEDLAAELQRKGEPVVEAVASTGTGVFDTLKAVAKQVLTELRKS